MQWVHVHQWSPQWLTETNSFKLTVSLSMLWHEWGSYCTWSEPSKPVRFNNKREVCFYSWWCFYQFPFVATVLFFYTNSAPTMILTSCGELLIFCQMVWQEYIVPVRRVVEAEKKAWGLLTLLAGVWFCCHLDIIGGQQARDPTCVSFPPVRVGLVQDVDQLTLGEAQLIPIGSSVVVHRNNLAHWSERHKWGLIS